VNILIILSSSFSITKTILLGKIIIRFVGAQEKYQGQMTKATVIVTTRNFPKEEINLLAMIR